LGFARAQVPFEGASNYETARRSVKRSASHRRSNNTTFHPSSTRFALNALEVDRERRIPSAREFQSKVLEVLAKLRPKLLPADVRHIVDCSRAASSRTRSSRSSRPPRVVEKPAGKASADSVDLVMQTPIWGPGTAEA